MARTDRARRDGIGDEPSRTVATYTTYAQAERAVDYLSDHNFPVDRVSIVARDLKLVEQVTGRRGYLEAALQGAASGGLIGLLVGWLFGLFNWFDPVTSAFWLAIDGLWFGAVVGLLFGLLMHALTRGRRDFDSVAAVSAERYDLMVQDAYATEAARLLAELEAPAAPIRGAPGTADPRAA
jgi:hypothetical protein